MRQAPREPAAAVVVGGAPAAIGPRFAVHMLQRRMSVGHVGRSGACTPGLFRRCDFGHVDGGVPALAVVVGGHSTVVERAVSAGTAVVVGGGVGAASGSGVGVVAGSGVTAASGVGVDLATGGGGSRVVGGGARLRHQ